MEILAPRMGRLRFDIPVVGHLSPAGVTAGLGTMGP